jgi:hypothetical protein
MAVSATALFLFSVFMSHHVCLYGIVTAVSSGSTVLVFRNEEGKVTQAHKQQGDLISLIFFFQNKWTKKLTTNMVLWIKNSSCKYGTNECRIWWSTKPANTVTWLYEENVWTPTEARSEQMETHYHTHQFQSMIWTTGPICRNHLGYIKGFI